KLGAGLLPGHVPLRVAGDLNLAADSLEFLGFRIECRGRLFEESSERIERCTACGGGYSTYRGRASRRTGGRILVVSDEQRDGFERKTQCIGTDNGNHSARSGPEVLRSHLALDGTVRMDCEVAIARMSRPAPRVNRETKSTSHRTGTRAARVPVLLPID